MRLNQVFRVSKYVPTNFKMTGLVIMVAATSVCDIAHSQRKDYIATTPFVRENSIPAPGFIKLFDKKNAAVNARGEFGVYVRASYDLNEKSHHLLKVYNHEGEFIRETSIGYPNDQFKGLEADGNKFIAYGEDWIRIIENGEVIHKYESPGASTKIFMSARIFKDKYVIAAFKDVLGYLNTMVWQLGSKNGLLNATKYKPDNFFGVSVGNKHFSEFYLIEKGWDKSVEVSYKSLRKVVDQKDNIFVAAAHNTNPVDDEEHLEFTRHIPMREGGLVIITKASDVTLNNRSRVEFFDGDDPDSVVTKTLPGFAIDRMFEPIETDNYYLFPFRGMALRTNDFTKDPVRDGVNDICVAVFDKEKKYKGFYEIAYPGAPDEAGEFYKISSNEYVNNDGYHGELKMYTSYNEQTGEISFYQFQEDIHNRKADLMHTWIFKMDLDDL